MPCRAPDPVQLQLGASFIVDRQSPLIGPFCLLRQGLQGRFRRNRASSGVSMTGSAFSQMLDAAHSPASVSDHLKIELNKCLATARVAVALLTGRTIEMRCPDRQTLATCA
jgi:hypothetical protein